MKIPEDLESCFYIPLLGVILGKYVMKTGSLATLNVHQLDIIWGMRIIREYDYRIIHNLNIHWSSMNGNLPNFTPNMPPYTKIGMNPESMTWFLTKITQYHSE